MDKNIKLLKPNKNSRFKQGYFPTNRAFKYIGSFPIIYRSSLELRFMEWCETSSQIKSWSSEPFAIPYIGPDGKKHNYWIDFVIETIDGKIILIEVKPLSQVPINESQLKYDLTMAKNAAKWNAVRKHCEINKDKKLYFKIITEKFFKQ